MKIVVLDGSGRVGGNVVCRSVAHEHDPVPASPSAGVDTITDDGLADGMAGADVVNFDTWFANQQQGARR